MQECLNSLQIQIDITEFHGKLPLEIQKCKRARRDPTHGPYHIYGYLPDAHLIYTKEIKINTADVVS